MGQCSSLVTLCKLVHLKEGPALYVGQNSSGLMIVVLTDVLGSTSSALWSSPRVAHFILTINPTGRNFGCCPPCRKALSHGKVKLSPLCCAGKMAQ